jgi:hypothetical protein
MPVLIDSDGRLIRAAPLAVATPARDTPVPCSSRTTLHRRRSAVPAMNRVRYYWDGLIAVIFVVWVIGLIVGAAIGTWLR